MKKLLFVGLMSIVSIANGEMISTKISGPAERNPSFGGDTEYSFSSINHFFDPAVTKWAAINADFPDIMMEDVLRPGERFLGAHGVGVDDFIRITITNPIGVSLTKDVDKNDIRAEPIGPQAIIFSNTTDVPIIRRGSQFIEHEEGAFNEIFTTAGIYSMQFSFRDSYGGSASHGDIWMLSSVPEPSTVILLLLGVLMIGIYKWRRRLC